MALGRSSVSNAPIVAPTMLPFSRDVSSITACMNEGFLFVVRLNLSASSLKIVVCKLIERPSAVATTLDDTTIISPSAICPCARNMVARSSPDWITGVRMGINSMLSVYWKRRSASSLISMLSIAEEPREISTVITRSLNGSFETLRINILFHVPVCKNVTVA